MTHQILEFLKHDGAVALFLLAVSYILKIAIAFESQARSRYNYDDGPEEGGWFKG